MSLLMHKMRFNCYVGRGLYMRALGHSPTGMSQSRLQNNVYGLMHGCVSVPATAAEPREDMVQAEPVPERSRSRQGGPVAGRGAKDVDAARESEGSAGAAGRKPPH